MAQDTLQQQAKAQNPEGMNDNAPSEFLPAWYQTNGVHSQGQHFIQRRSGNLLIHKFDGPILAMHGDIRNRIFVETTKALYMFENLYDAIPGAILGDNDLPITGDDGLFITE